MASSSTSNSSKDTIAKYIPLYRAIRRGDWEKAEEIFNGDEDALTAKIDASGNSALHIAINMRKNIQFVENLLKKMNPETFPTLVNEEQRNVLHNAAVVGNIKAAKMVVNENSSLLFIPDVEQCLPIHRAILNCHIETFQYLLQVSEQYKGHFLQEGYCYSPFQGEFGIMLIDNVINGGLYDVAYMLITKYPELARTKNGSFIPLKSIANKRDARDAYFSSTGYNIYQRFVYFCMFSHLF
ncbi:hypothetical protein OSB04_012950 [Centaurea solstitialis]|uniref:Uncharacterized protein n=1 Tax=Centaurea solstitialis TaxID=347529 RepID=A0AA38WQZ4_9ASTR|nr:hypothetical protein OSB04_012950 [Centaurea solstitialis]